eukprot:523925-Prymnesium_polylepis.1
MGNLLQEHLSCREAGGVAPHIMEGDMAVIMGARVPEMDHSYVTRKRPARVVAPRPRVWSQLSCGAKSVERSVPFDQKCTWGASRNGARATHSAFLRCLRR